MTVQPAPDNLASMPNPRPLKHRWHERTPTPVRDDKTGCERHERLCEVCKITRTTVIPPRGQIWIEWEWDDGAKQIDGLTPRCEAVSAEVTVL